jgi:hypothetical protein
VAIVKGTTTPGWGVAALRRGVAQREGADEGARGLRGGLRQARWRVVRLHHRLGVVAELGEEGARLELSSVVQGSLAPVRQCAGGEGDRSTTEVVEIERN